MKNKVIRLGVAGTLTALSLAAAAVPAQASATDPCGQVTDSVKICTAASGATYPVAVSETPLGPVPGIGGALLLGNTLTVFDGAWDPGMRRDEGMAYTRIGGGRTLYRLADVEAWISAQPQKIAS